MKLQVEIIKMVPPGEGLGYFNDKAVFVPGTTIGDVVEVSVNREKKRHITATLERVLSPGKDRITAPCPHYEDCGGCSLMHLTYPDQVALKRQLLIETFASQRIEISPGFHPSPTEFRFRYRTTVKLEDNTIGFAAKRSHRIIDIHDCRILSPGIMNLLPQLRQLGRNHCEFSLLESSATGETAVSLGDGKTLSMLPGYPQSVTENYGFGNLLLNSNGFAQSNPLITPLICQYLQEAVDDHDRICELYCGCGTFSIPLAKKATSLAGYDIDKASITNALNNATENQLENIEMTAVNLEKGIRFPDCSVVVVDPPRKGLGPGILRQIGESRSVKLLYVSCNPASLARDTRALVDTYAFRLMTLNGYDMYCHSSHTEVLAVFER